MKSVRSKVGLVFSLFVLIGCNDVQSPGDPSTAQIAFPDSVRFSPGLPPAASAPQRGRPVDVNGTSDVSGLIAHARSEIIGLGPHYIRTTATLVNPGTRAVNIANGACEPSVRAKRGSDAPQPVWPANFGCVAALYTQSAGPGDSVEFVQTFEVDDILNDKLTPGRYSITATLRIYAYSFTGGAGDGRLFELPAGEVDIPNDDKLSPVQSIDGLSYVARTMLVIGPADEPLIRALVLVKNTSNIRRYGSYFGSCPVVLYVYRSATERDALPYKSPVLTLTGSCNDNQLRTFALDPGQSWVFGTDMPRASLVGRQPAGHFWFTAQLGAVRIAAGEAALP